MSDEQTFSDHQERILRSMIDATDAAIAGDITATALADRLEGLLNAGEFGSLHRDWVKYWGSIEEIRESPFDNPDNPELRSLLQAMREFLELLIR